MHGDARNVAGDVGEALEALVPDEVLGDDAERLRNVDQRRVGLGRDRRAVGVNADRAGARILRLPRNGFGAAPARAAAPPATPPSRRRDRRAAVGVLAARRFASGAVISIGGSCDVRFAAAAVAAAVCARAGVAQANTPNGGAAHRKPNSLREIERMPRAGAHDLALLSHDPQFIACVAPRTQSQFAHAVHLQRAMKCWYRAKKFGSTRIGASGCLNPSRSKRF